MMPARLLVKRAFPFALALLVAARAERVALVAQVVAVAATIVVVVVVVVGGSCVGAAPRPLAI